MESCVLMTHHEILICSCKEGLRKGPVIVHLSNKVDMSDQHRARPSLV